MLGWGAYIDVGSGHRGFLHVNDMKWPEGVMAPSAYDCVKEDQVLEVSMLACHLQIASWMHSHLMLTVLWRGACNECVDREQVLLICMACLSRV